MSVNLKFQPEVKICFVNFFVSFCKFMVQCNGNETMKLHTINTAYNKMQHISRLKIALTYNKITYYSFIVC
jgi:RPA family protein